MYFNYSKNILIILRILKVVILTKYHLLHDYTSGSINYKFQNSINIFYCLLNQFLKTFYFINVYKKNVIMYKMMLQLLRFQVF